VVGVPDSENVKIWYLSMFLKTKNTASSPKINKYNITATTVHNTPKSDIDILDLTLTFLLLFIQK
jgi:hypothetical protein